MGKIIRLADRRQRNYWTEIGENKLDAYLEQVRREHEDWARRFFGKLQDRVEAGRRGVGA